MFNSVFSNFFTTYSMKIKFYICGLFKICNNWARAENAYFYF